MFNLKAFANSLALTAAILYIVFGTLLALSRPIFDFLFNAQFIGADISSLIPDGFGIAQFIGVLITVVITTWITAYIWGGLYNSMAKKK